MRIERAAADNGCLGRGHTHTHDTHTTHTRHNTTRHDTTQHNNTTRHTTTTQKQHNNTTMKKQIILSINGSVWDVAEEREWKRNMDESAVHILPHVMIGREGEVWPVMATEEPTSWLTGGETMDTERVHVALCNAGPLVRRGDAFYTHTGEAVRLPYEFCSQSPYRGHRYYELLTPKQLLSAERLLNRLIKTLGIRYRYDAMLGDVCPRCLGGDEGVWLASGLMKQRTDPHPQTELIKMMQRLGKETETEAENGGLG